MRQSIRIKRLPLSARNCVISNIKLKKMARGNGARTGNTLSAAAARAACNIVPVPQAACSAPAHGSMSAIRDRKLFFLINIIFFDAISDGRGIY